MMYAGKIATVQCKTVPIPTRTKRKRCFIKYTTYTCIDNYGKITTRGRDDLPQPK